MENKKILMNATLATLISVGLAAKSNPSYAAEKIAKESESADEIQKNSKANKDQNEQNSTDHLIEKNSCASKDGCHKDGCNKKIK